MLVKPFLSFFLLLAAGSLQVARADLHRRVNDEDALASLLLQQIRVKGQTDAPTPTSASTNTNKQTAEAKQLAAHSVNKVENAGLADVEPVPTTDPVVASIMQRIAVEGSNTSAGKAKQLPARVSSSTSKQTATTAASNENDDNNGVLLVLPVPTTDPVVPSIMNRIAVSGNSNSGTRNAHLGSTTPTPTSKTSSARMTTTTNTSLLIQSILDQIAVPQETSEKQADPPNAGENVLPSKTLEQGNKSQSKDEQPSDQNSGSLDVDKVLTTDAAVQSIMNRISVAGSTGASKADLLDASSSDTRSTDKQAKGLPDNRTARTEIASPIPTTDPQVASIMGKVALVGQSTRDIDEQENGGKNSDAIRAAEVAASKALTTSTPTTQTSASLDGAKFNSMASVTEMADVLKLIDVGGVDQNAPTVSPVSPVSTTDSSSASSLSSSSSSKLPSLSASPSPQPSSSDNKYQIPAPLLIEEPIDN
ncbi:hypothetical protein IWW45_001446 [Coemansia sp. RSA 485]|nr:hypothetical protein IWW45_001446 [Coemansia sp. RSA 485]